MFRHIEDSGGRLNLGNAYEETYLNTVMDEARTNLVFFRPPGGNPGIVNDTTHTLPPGVPAVHTVKS